MLDEPAGCEPEQSFGVPQFPFRLRHLLVLAVFASLLSWVYPKGRAAWNLHNQAVIYADYALCMAGPTGPDLLREDPEGFREFVRRRIVASMPESVPLRGCEKFAIQMPISHSSYRLHSMKAVRFLEYHGSPSARRRATLSELEVSLAPLQELADQAWPFVRSGPEPLMKPSSHTKEAAHPYVAPQAGTGSGLPARRHLYRSTAAYGDTVVASLGSGANASVILSKNGGVDWVRGGTRLASEIRDRCLVDEEGRAFTLSRTNDGKRIVVSQGPQAAPQVAILSSGDMKLAGTSCDKGALIAALVSEPDDSGHRPVTLRMCPFRRPCETLPLPDLGGEALYYPLDVARIGGDTVVSVSSGGVSRVTSTRDDGRTWMPWTVAYDSQVSGGGGSAPFRLLVTADHLLLYTGANDGSRYPLLISTDHGASFCAPARAAVRKDADAGRFADL